MLGFLFSIELSWWIFLKAEGVEHFFARFFQDGVCVRQNKYEKLSYVVAFIVKIEGKKHIFPVKVCPVL